MDASSITLSNTTDGSPGFFGLRWVLELRQVLFRHTKLLERQLEDVQEVMGNFKDCISSWNISLHKCQTAVEQRTRERKT